MRRPISIVRAATIRVRRCPRAIRPIVRWSASGTGVAAPGASTIRTISRTRRGLLAEEQRAGAHRRMIAASRACAAPAWSNRAMARSRPRSTAPAAITAVLNSSGASATRPARQLAPPTINAGPGPMPGRDMSAGSAHCFLKKEIKPPRRKPGFTRAWSGNIACRRRNVMHGARGNRPSLDGPGFGRAGQPRSSR